MIDYQKDLEKIKNLKVGEHCYVHWFEEGGGVVYCINGETSIEYELFEVGMFGGHEIFTAIYQKGQEEEMLDRVYTWT